MIRIRDDHFDPTDDESMDLMLLLQILTDDQEMRWRIHFKFSPGFSCRNVSLPLLPFYCDAGGSPSDPANSLLSLICLIRFPSQNSTPSVAALCDDHFSSRASSQKRGERISHFLLWDHSFCFLFLFRYEIRSDMADTSAVSDP